jgi:all-trans-retinol dehydrogenase (NAD+)
MTKIKGSTVLITGGASGIGRLMGDMCMQQLAKQVVLWDVNHQKLDETTRELRALHYIVHPYTVDVSDQKAMIDAVQRVKNEVGSVDILINNAGIIVGKSFEEHTHADIDRTLAINSLALMHLTLEFLPGMIEAGHGHIVNISSAAGMIANPGMSVYCASKWAVYGWSESLRLELEMKKSGIHVTTVTPSYISTGMFSGVKTSVLIPMLDPAKIAGKIIHAIKTNKLFVRAPFMVKLLPFTKGILPARWFDFVAGKMFGVYDSMKSFKGHGKSYEL